MEPLLLIGPAENASAPPKKTAASSSSSALIDVDVTARVGSMAVGSVMAAIDVYWLTVA